MAYTPLNLGDGISREPLGSALKKIDTMISELYTTIPEGDFSAVSQNIVPDGDLTYNLGSPSNRWHSLYVGSGSIYVGDAVISATTNGQIILPGVYEPTAHQAVEVYSEPGPGQERTWGAPENAFLIDNFTFQAYSGGSLVPAGWVRAEYLATLDEEGYISGAIVVDGGNEYSELAINGVVDVPAVCTDFMYVHTPENTVPDPLDPFVSSDWTIIPFAVRCQATNVNLSSTIGQNVSYNDLTDLPDQSLNTTDEVEFADVTTPSITNSTNTWLFGTDGALDFPTNLKISPLNAYGPINGTMMIQDANESVHIVTPGDDAHLLLGWSSTNGLKTATIGFNADSDSLEGAKITTGNYSGTVHGWIFGTDATLTLPAGGTIEFDNGSFAVGSYTRNINDPFAINVADTAGEITLNWGVSHSSYTNKIKLDQYGVTLTTNTTNTFEFSTDGSVTLPTNSYIRSDKSTFEQGIVGWKEFLAGPTIGWGLYSQNDIYIQTDNDITKPTWIFKENGTTQFPAFTFPATDGTNGQVLTTNGAGVLSWTSVSSGGTDISTASINDLADVTISDPVVGQVLKWNGTAWINDTDLIGEGGGGGTLSTRTTRSAATSSIANDASANITVSGFKSYALLSIQTSAAAWVTVYSTTAARTADASRTITDDPTPGSGVLAEVITSGAQTQVFSPGVFGYNDEGTPTTDIYLKVVNKSGSSAAITVTLKLLQLEA